MYQSYRQVVAFYIVYIQEAHATDAWQMPVNEREKVLYAETHTLDERADVANACVRDLHLSIPALLDDPRNSTEAAYTGWPDRLYAIDRDGRIAYKSGPGPYGFKPKEMEHALRALIGAPALDGGTGLKALNR